MSGVRIPQGPPSSLSRGTLMASNYSVDFIKKAAFVDELNNVLRVMEVEFPDLVDENIVAVMTYLESRIKQIEVDHRSY